MPNGKEYKQGLRDGATQTNIDGLSKSVDDMWHRVDQLPCGKVHAEVEALRTSVKRWWVLLLALFTSQAAIIAMMIKMLDLILKYRQ